MKKFVIVFIAVILLFAVYIVNEMFNSNKDEMIFYGNVDTKVVDLAFRFLGKIERIDKREGTAVKKGEEIVFMDDSYLQNSLKNIQTQIKTEEIKLQKLMDGYRIEEILSAKASYEAALANLNDAKQKFERQQKLMDTNATSVEIYANSKNTYEAMSANANFAKANYQKLKNGYEKADIAAQKEAINLLKVEEEKLKLDIKNSVLIAPNDGVLQRIYKEPGSVASADEAVVQIAKMDKIFVRAYIDEPFIGAIKLGQKMKIYSDARSEPYLGEVSFISSVAEFTPKYIQTMELRADLVYKFEVAILDADDKIKLGQPVHIKFSDDKS